MNTTGQGLIDNTGRGNRYPTGYIPHAYTGDFECKRCKGTRFKCYPQSVPGDRRRTWTWEYVCANCGYGMALTVLGDDEIKEQRE